MADSNIASVTTVADDDDSVDGRNGEHEDADGFDEDIDDDEDNEEGENSDDDTDDDMTVKGMHTAASSQQPHSSTASQQVPCVPKSYVSVLNEIASQRCEPLTYELMKAEGFSHQPMFVYKVRMGQHSANGEGRRKKEAKQDAARSLLVVIGETFENEEEETAALASKSLSILDDARRRGWTPGDGDAPTAAANSASDSAPGNSGTLSGSLSLVDGVGENKMPFAGQSTPIPSCKMHNPVGSVQEMTMFMRWPPPQFKIERQSGPPHDAIFTMACFVWDQKTIGTGKSKKEAKRLSALAMYNYLRYNPNVIREWRLREGLAHSSANRTQDIKKVRASEENPRRLQHPEMSECRDKPSMQRLIKITDVFNRSAYESYNTTPLDLLQMLAMDYQFNISFEDVQVESATLPPERERGGYPLWAYLLNLHKNPTEGAEKNDASSAKESEKLDDVKAGEASRSSDCKEPAKPPPTRRVWCSTIRLSTKTEIFEFGTGITKQAARERACLNVLQYIKIHTYDKFSEFGDLSLKNFLNKPWHEVTADYERIRNKHIVEEDTNCEEKSSTSGAVSNKTASGKAGSIQRTPLCYDLVPDNHQGMAAWSIDELERYLEQDPFMDATAERFIELEMRPFFEEDEL